MNSFMLRPLRQFEEFLVADLGLVGVYCVPAACVAGVFHPAPSVAGYRHGVDGLGLTGPGPFVFPGTTCA